MKNHAINKAFLEATDAETKASVLGAIAKHYGISRAEAFLEVTDESAEYLVDYLTGGVRTAVHFMMQRHGLHA